MNLEEQVKISFNSTQARRRKLKIAAANTGMSQTELLNHLVDEYCDKVNERTFADERPQLITESGHFISWDDLPEQ